MATIAGNSYPSEFNFIDNPIMVGVTNFVFPTDSTFRQAMVKVDVTPTFSGETTSYNFYADASADTTVWIDISTALRAAMNAWQPDLDFLSLSNDNAFDCTYPYATFGVTVFEKYLLEGVVNEIEGASQSGAYAYYGGLTEYERMVFSSHAADFYSGMFFTRKPASGELHAVGDISTSSICNAVSKTVSTHGEVMPAASCQFEKGEMTQFLFVNSLGVFEAVSAISRESLSYDMETERKNLSTTPQYKAKPVITTHKTGGHGKFEMSSGFVNREWADWWTTEFLRAKRHWMLHSSGTWLPVAVIPADDTTVIYDRSEQRLPHVDFDVEVAVSGSIMNQVRK